LLWLADVGTNDVVYDLGSGDGRVVIAAVHDFHARKAVGIEINPQLIRESRENAAKGGVSGCIDFIQGDLFTNDFSEASVVVLYLGPAANLDLRAKLVRTLKPGARVVSHQFGMGEWPADKTLDVRTVYLGMYGEYVKAFKTNPDVPDFDDSRSQRDHDTLSAWIVPAPVAGVWRGKVPADSGERELKLTLHQRLSGLNGSFQLQGPTNIQGIVAVDLWGDHLRCWCISTSAAWYGEQIWIDGHVQGDSLNGDLRMWQGTNTVQTQWTAHRNPVDFSGTWEWTGASNAPVQLKLGHRHGQLVATYTDMNREKNAWRDETRPVPVFDFYDFGGGFYFTLLLGLEGNSYSRGSRTMGPQYGWVVGEAILEDGVLKGTFAFYPYPEIFTGPGRPQQASQENAPSSGRRDWQPKRMVP
jgi:SAM-dependent methyltransferase